MADSIFLEELFKDEYLPSQFKQHQRWVDWYGCMGYIFDILRKTNEEGTILKLPDLVDVDNVPIKYIERLAARSGFRIQQTFGNDNELRLQLKEAVYWTKIRGTATGIRGAVRSYGLKVVLYNMYTRDYVNFIRSQVGESFGLLSDVGLISDDEIVSDEPNTFYLSSHFEVEIVLERKIEENYLLTAEIVNLVKDRVDNHVKPIVSFPRYYSKLDAITKDDNELYIDGKIWSEWADSFSHPIAWKDVNNVPQAEIYSIVTDNWVNKFFEESDFLGNKFELGIGNNDEVLKRPIPPLKTATSLDNPIYESTIDSVVVDETNSILYIQGELSIAEEADGYGYEEYGLDDYGGTETPVIPITEFGLYDKSNNLIVLSTFPKIEVVGGYGKRFIFKIEYTPVTDGFGILGYGFGEYGLE